MRVDQLHAGKNMWVKYPILEEIFNLFLYDRFYPDVEFYAIELLWMKNSGKAII